MKTQHVISFGSLNMDLVARVPRLPGAGETLAGLSFVTVPGGKGANQAVAVARLGMPTVMVGRVGSDSFGQTLLQALQASGVQTGGVCVDEAHHTGVALITVSQAGENHIVIIPEANGQLDEDDVHRCCQYLVGASLLLLQLEIPLGVVQAVAVAARERGVPVILDPAPAQELPSELYACVSILTPNALEAGQLLGFPVTDIDAAAEAATILRQRGVDTVIITLGRQGVFCATATEAFHVPAYPVDVVDTVAAGDAFNGGLAAGLTEGLSLKQAVLWGTAASALSVMRPGAQSSLPNRPLLEQFLRESGDRPWTS